MMAIGDRYNSVARLWISELKNWDFLSDMLVDILLISELPFGSIEISGLAG